ncbi:hypothetical protein J2Y48_002867 [Mycoplana sp. BE70]|nr:hypothetical protein [Mycoplana sp. BE70]MDR6757570.1 hypothetical protein [Mycoplana sp. BE70]
MIFMAGCCIWGQAQAQQRFPDGSYGDADGCRYALTGETTGSDLFFLLDKEGITTSVSYCAFKDEAKKIGDAFTATVACHAEGDDAAETESIAIVPAVDGSVTITFSEGTAWGPLVQCR